MNRVLRACNSAFVFVAKSSAVTSHNCGMVAKRCISVPFVSRASPLQLANRCAPLVNAQRFAEHAACNDSTQDRVLKVVREFDKLSAQADKVTIQSLFAKDLGLDSLDRIELVMALEDAFGCEIPDSDAEKLETPADIVKYLKSKGK